MGLEIINKLKKQKGLTNEDLSTLSGVPKGTIDKITAGTTKDPKLETLKAIAQVLNCSLNDFGEMKNSGTPIETETEELSSDKKQILKDYDSLNEEGQRMALEYMDWLIYNKKYKKRDDSKELA